MNKDKYILILTVLLAIIIVIILILISYMIMNSIFNSTHGNGLYNFYIPNPMPPKLN